MSSTRIAIIVSRWNELVTKELLEGSLDELSRAGVDCEQFRVPGTWELPVAAKALLARAESTRPHGIVALGCILQGQTPHAKLLASDVSSALMRLQVETGVPIGWGVLTPESQEQALDRAGMKMGNKGREATLATLEMVQLVRDIGK